ncbi:MAG: hypothetical protein ACLP59_18530 [Bryobacteraceae bacterium]
MNRIGAAIALPLVAGFLYASNNNSPDSGVPVSMVVTVKPSANAQPTADNTLVSQDRQRRTITSFEPLHSSNGMQVWILIDDGLGKDLGSQLGDIRRFILSQPATTLIGVGYVRNGFVQKAQPVTADHELAAKALRLPTGPPGISASPYSALSDLISKWPASAAAREVVLISSGIDPDFGTGPDNPYLDQAIHEAERANVVVYSIYYPGFRAGRLTFWGENYLAEISQDTGGEMFWIGPQEPVSLAPYLDDVTARLNGQYLLTFLARPESKAGLRNVSVKSELPHVKITAPQQVYVPAK